MNLLSRIPHLGLLLTTILVSHVLPAQILNIEDERIKTDTTGWGGKTRLSLNYQKTDVDFFKSDVFAHLQFKRPAHLYLLLLEHSLSKGDGTEFTNASTQHFRYNYKLNKTVVAEAFVQGQFNKVLHVQYRFLAGAGPRFALIKKDYLRLYLGNIYMYETEYLTDGIVNRQHRLSNYLSATIQFSKWLSMVHTTYYQPMLAHYHDYRIFSQSALKLSFTKHFRFSFDYKYYFDSHPPAGIVNSTHYVLNGIEFVF